MNAISPNGKVTWAPRAIAAANGGEAAPKTPGRPAPAKRGAAAKSARRQPDAADRHGLEMIAEVGDQRLAAGDRVFHRRRRQRGLVALFDSQTSVTQITSGSLASFATT